MITYIKIDGFKSFKDFEMFFSPLTVIAGVNASGKSNLFDALRFLSALASGEKLSASLESYRGEGDELFMQYHDGTREDKMSFSVDFLLDKTVTDDWGTVAEVSFNRLRYTLVIARPDGGSHDYSIVEEKLEPIFRSTDVWLNSYPAKIRERMVYKIAKAKNKPFLDTKEEEGKRYVEVSDINQPTKSRRYNLQDATCSVISRFNNADYIHLFAARKEMMKWMYLQLEPEALRTPSPKNASMAQLMPNGKLLPNVVNALKVKDDYNLTVIARKVNHFLPSLVDIDVQDDKDNMRYVLKMKDKNGIWFTSRTLSEGTLRIISLCVLAVGENAEGLLCYEEPENGINPQRIELMAELMQDLSSDFMEGNGCFRQVIVNTHSPLFVQAVYSQHSPMTTICFSRMISAIGKKEGKMLKYSKTKITPVVEGEKKQLMEYSDQDVKLSIRDLQHYLSNDNYSN